MNLTASQRRAVEHRGSNLLVSASAGAGKTEVLAQRCVGLIADSQRPCDLDRLLVVTFTRAAAAELRVRIADMLRRAATNAPAGPLQRHLRRQQLLVQAAEIGTIDAWCGRLVREHFAQAGVDVAFTVLGGQDAQVFRAAVLDELFDWIHGANDPLAADARAWVSRATSPDDGFLRDLVAGLSRYREHLVNPEAWFARQAAPGPGRDAEPVLARELANECAFQHAQLVELPEAVVAALAPYRAALAAWQQSLDNPGTLVTVVDLIKDFKFGGGRKRKDAPPEPAGVAEVRERWFKKRLKERWKPDVIKSILACAPRTAALTQTLLRLEARYQELLTAAKRAAAKYEFGDVLRMALDLLGTPAAGHERTPTDIARRLQRRYEHILVDEYQDTSPVQVEILRLVTRAEPGRTNRFMVGDVKQSIYGFREAEPRLFTALVAALEAGSAEGRVEYLADNFRSHADLLAALNQLFAALFDPALGGTAYGPQERLQAGRAGSELANPTLGGPPRVEVHVISADADSTDAGDDDEPNAEELEPEIIEREAQLAAAQIRELLASGAQVPARDADGTLRLRPLQLNDIVILLRSAVHAAGQAASVLRRNGLACVTAGRETLLDAVEVRDVCNVLKLLVNRRQDVALAAYLRSPLAGLSAADLLAIRGACPQPRADFYAAVEHYGRARRSAALAARLDAALAQLDDWARAARELELPALLRRIYQDSGLLLLAGALQAGAQRIALLQSLQNLAAAFAGQGPGDLDGFLTYLERLRNEDLDPGALAAGPEDAVRIMTIHGAKGLEFPVVFLLGTGIKFNVARQRETLHADEEVGLGLRFGDYPARATLQSATHFVLQRRVAQRELEEELRLLYVAATRARERLYLVGHGKADAWAAHQAQVAERAGPPPLIARLSASNRLEWILMATARAPDDPPLIRVATHKAGDIVIAPSAQAAPTEADVTLTDEDESWLARGRALLGAEVGSVLADVPAIMSVSALKEAALREHAADQPFIVGHAGEALPRPTFAAKETTDGRDLGTACHRFLELADLGKLGSAAAVNAQVEALRAGGRLSAAQAALVPVADLVWFATTELGTLLSGYADRIRREVPFVFALPVGDSGARTIVRGIIDCLLELPAGLTLIDYKTDRVRDAADLEVRLAGYRVQMQAYARAASAIFARPVTRAALVLLRARQVVDVPPAPVQLSDLLAGEPAAADVPATPP